MGHPNLGGPLAIRDDEFFDEIDWLDLYLKKTVPPFQTFMKLKSDVDLVNFDNLPEHDQNENDLFMRKEDDEDQVSSQDDLFKNFSYIDPNF